MNEEIYQLFAYKPNYIGKAKLNYFYGQNKIYILIEKKQYKNTISIYHTNKNEELKLELLLNYYDQNGKDESINLLKEIGYDKYQGYLLFSGNDLASPIFDVNQKQIGNAYKYYSTIDDYTNFNYSFEIRKIFLLYINYQLLINNSSTNNNNNKFREYYIINKKFIHNYKKYYNYDTIISTSIEKNFYIQNVLNNQLNTRENNIFNIKDKLLALMVKQLPKNLLDDFNEKDKNFKNFKKNEKKVPNMGKINYDSNENFFYYYDFELISEEIFDYLFNFINLQNNNDIVKSSEELEFNIDKPEKVECLIDKNYIIIKFLNQTAENKYLLEIGNLNSEKIFEPEYFLLYDKLTYLYEHINNVIEAGGFNLYSELLKSFQMNTLDIIGDNDIKYGIVIKKNMNESNVSNYFFDQDFTNDQLQNFQSMNRSRYNQSQKSKYQQNSLIINQRNNQFFNINKKIFLKDIFLRPPRVGLNNIGAAVYMNAILQCFCQIEELVIYFKYDNHVNEIKDNYNEKYLTPSFKILIEEIWPKDAEKNEPGIRYYSPFEFRKKIADMNPLFVNIQANDSKNFIDFIIRTLHEELNNGFLSSNINTMTTYLNNNNQFDNVFQVFYEIYQRALRSKISELFYAISHTTTQCLNCKNCQYNFQAYNFLAFHLEEVKKYTIEQIYKNNNININNNLLLNNNSINNNLIMSNNIMMNNFNNFTNIINNNMDRNELNRNKNNAFMNSINHMTFGMNNIGNNMNNNFVILNNDNNINYNDINIKLNKLNNNIVNISDCFDYIQKKDMFQDGYKMLCSYCGLMSNMSYSSNLTTTPKILIILLNRGIGIQYKIKLQFSTELDISKYITKKTGDIKYELIGVITHLGEIGEGGHFIAHCLSPIDNRWYTYNDSFVNETVDFQRNIIDFGMPYFLFYKKLE